jgi:hypothetical protein
MDDNIAGIRLGLSFNIRRGRMLIYHSTIRAMGEPEYIRFLFNNRDKKIAVQRCEAIDRDSFRVPKVVPGDRFQFDITSSPFLSVVYKACHWSLDESYLVYGVNHPEHNLVEFELKEAIQITPEQFIDPENLI